MPELRGKVAIVTGGASGIGRATALLFAQAGASVVVADVDDDRGEETVRAIGDAGGRGLYRRVDVCDELACAGAVDAALARFGRLDVAFNNAGIAGRTSVTDEQGLEQWRRVIDVNLTGVFNCMVPQLRAMKAGGGAIVNTASIAGTAGAAGAAAYSASKHGVIGLTRSAALEYAKHGIRINCVSPGYVETPMTVGEATVFSRGRIDDVVAQTPMRRLAHAREIGELVLWLCSGRASFVTGANYVADGGATAHY
jgi:NAD(P)-dependent dehydrogenase (short-subunit alcohol dehydrogenase family)